MKGRSNLGVYLEPSQSESIRVGTLALDANGLTQFVVDEAYIALGPDRPIFASAFLGINDEEKTIDRLRHSSMLKGGRDLPPWFSNVLPEGALRSLVESGMPTGSTTDFDVLKWVGLDLPGAVVVREDDASSGIDLVQTFYNGRSDGVGIRFSLAGVQMKMSMLKKDESLTLPGTGSGGNIIAKLPSAKIPFLPEVEFTTMELARSIGIEVPDFELVPIGEVDGLPPHLLEAGETVLSVKRFDRSADGRRIHMEDFAQITGAVGDRKYTAANEETVFKIARVFGGGPAAFLEATRRIAANIMFGNTDAHLKNWSLWYPEPNRGRLSPAYDLVAFCVYDHSDDMALRFRNTRNARIMDLSKFSHAAKFCNINLDRVAKEVRLTVERAADEWPERLRGLPMPEKYASYLLERTRTLALVGEFDVSFRAADKTAEQSPGYK